MRMNIKSILAALIVPALVSGLLAGSAAANVPGVAINAPPPPPAPNLPVQGGMGLIEVVVSHRDSMIPATHYVDHIYLFDGNNLLKEWKYTEKDANPNKVFTESIMMPATKDMNLKAVAHCTLHGYDISDVYVTVLPAGTKPADMVAMNANIAGMQVKGMDPGMAASVASQMAQQDAQLLSQIQSSERSGIQQHQMMTARFFQSPEGKQFLDVFDYTKKAGAAGQPGMAAPAKAGMAAPGQMAQGQRMSMQPDMSDMRTDANVPAATQAGMAAPGQMAPGQMMPGQPGMATGIMAGPPGQGIPQTMWMDSMGNPVDGSSAKQLGQAAASMQPGEMAGQPMMPGQPGQGQLMPGQAGQAQ